MNIEAGTVEAEAANGKPVEAGAKVEPIGAGEAKANGAARAAARAAASAKAEANQVEAALIRLRFVRPLPLMNPYPGRTNVNEVRTVAKYLWEGVLAGAELRSPVDVTVRTFHPPVAVLPGVVLPDTMAVARAAKAAIDGLVDAGGLADDSSEYVRSVHFFPPQFGPEDGGAFYRLIVAAHPPSPPLPPPS